MDRRAANHLNRIADDLRDMAKRTDEHGDTLHGWDWHSLTPCQLLDMQSAVRRLDEARAALKAAEEELRGILRS